MRVKPRKKRRSYTADRHNPRTHQQRNPDVAIRITIEEQPSPIENLFHKISSALKRIFCK